MCAVTPARVQLDRLHNDITCCAARYVLGLCKTTTLSERKKKGKKQFGIRLDDWAVQHVTLNYKAKPS